MKGEKKIVEILLSDILPNRFQPRIKFNEGAIEELAESIKEHGVIQPIVVRQIGDKYEIIAGERRFKASILASLRTIPAIITDLDDKESAEIALIENVQRQDLTPIEEAISYKKILDMGYLTQESLANKLGRTQSTIANKIRLLNLNEDVQEALLNGKISERHARSLLKLDNDKNQKKLLNRIIDERLTVRKTDEEINKMLRESVKKDVDSDIEILDFDSIDIPKINNESLSNYNIPTAPIIDDVIDEAMFVNIDPIKEYKEIYEKDDDVDDIEERKKSNNLDHEDIVMDTSVYEKENFNNSNPGFMDIDKIENEAKDIFIEKKSANLEELLQKDKNMVASVKQEIPEIEIEEESLRPGKFFSLFSEQEEVKEDTVDNKVNEDENNESNENNENFNFDFNFSNVYEKEENNIISPEENNNDIFNNDYNDNITAKYEANQESFIKSEDNQIDQSDNDIKEVIKMIRECARNIEKYGFIVDTEEIDFETMYQVIFKIEKK